jgi:hypothetical protein
MPADGVRFPASEYRTNGVQLFGLHAGEPTSLDHVCRYERTGGLGCGVGHLGRSVFEDEKCNRPADGVRFPASEYYMNDVKLWASIQVNRPGFLIAGS